LGVWSFPYISLVFLIYYNGDKTMGKIDMKGLETTAWWKNLVPVVMGVILSGLGTLTNFAYDRIDELHNEVVEHRMMLSKLVTPDGKVIQSSKSNESKQKLSERITVLETKIEYLEK